VCGTPEAFQRFARGTTPGSVVPKTFPPREGWQIFNPSRVDWTFCAIYPGWYPGLIAAIPPG